MRDDDARHGTSAGYYAHKRAGQVPCRACKDGIVAYNRAYREGRRGTRSTIASVRLNQEDILTDGQWVLDRRSLVMRWHPNARTA